MNPMNPMNRIMEKRWEPGKSEKPESDVIQGLVKKTIVSVRYMSPEESKFNGWLIPCIIVTLDDGTQLISSGYFQQY